MPISSEMTLTSLINILSIIILFLIGNGIIRITSVVGLKKPIVKTIKTEYGAVYDCVNFYDQPAFKHPLLKNHDFYPQMRPSSRPKWKIPKNLKRGHEASIVKFKDDGCPLNTVPVRRMSKEEISQMQSFSKNLAPSRLYQNSTNAITPGVHRAIIQTKSSPSVTPYYGVGSWMTLWNPQTKSNQYSSGQILIQNSPDSIQVGWTVNPTLYKGNKTYNFIHTTTANGSRCFNTYCPGFVLVRADIPVDSGYDHTSIRGREAWGMMFFIYQDVVNGNWWLQLGDDAIGFWPKRIFGSLGQFGTYIECGGETYNPITEPGGGPPMGAGNFIVKFFSKPEWDACCQNFITVNEKHQVVDVQRSESFSDSKRYQARDQGFVKPFRHLAYYGGPGGDQS